MKITSSEKVIEQDYAVATLKAWLKEGDTVYTVIRSVAKSGMSRTMSLYVVKDGKLGNITYYAGKALGWTLTDTNGSRALRVSGGGMDMGFHTVYTLARVLFKDSSATDSGYLLIQEWV